MQIINFFYIRSNLSEDVDFRKLAADIGYSYDRFRHLFTETIGQSPKQYLLAARFEEAKRLLRNTDGKISGIAADCGCKFYFGSDAHHVDRLLAAPKNFARIAQLLELRDEQKFIPEKRKA